MAYLDGIVIAVPTLNKDRFIVHANTADQLFIEFGATRVIECWGVDVTVGETTDFRRAVAAKDDESIVFNWIEWPDKATRDSSMVRMRAPDFKDRRMDPEVNPMPFDGKRMIYGGFQPIVERGEPADREYVQGFVIPVRAGGREAYRKMAEEAWEMFRGYGALHVVEAWGDDVPTGKQTDFYRAVRAEPGEGIVFSYMTWPSREVCDSAAQAMQSDPNMKMPHDMPFDPKRMIYAGFERIIELKKGA